MKENFEKCLEMLLHHEGGYVNHPKDPGGETNLGVTKRVYENWCIEQDLLTKDMKELRISDVAPIYKNNYWDLYSYKWDDIDEKIRKILYSIRQRIIEKEFFGLKYQKRLRGVY